MLTLNLRLRWRTNMVVLIDTNILLDYILKREPFYEESQKVMEVCSTDTADGCIALHTVTTIWYLLRSFPEKSRRSALNAVCELLQVVGTSHDEVMNAINNADFKDFEDCIQSKCAKTANAGYIITRNISDFEASEIPAVTPAEFLASL